MNNLLSLDIVRAIQSVKVTPKEPEEVCVQRQLTCWLDPGWCMTPPTGSESKANRKSNLMLWWIAGVLMLLGLLVTSYPMGGLVSVALVLVIVIALVGLIQGPGLIVIAEKENGRLTGSGRASLIDTDDLARFEGEGGLNVLEPDRAEPQDPLMRAFRTPSACKPGVETMNEPARRQEEQANLPPATAG